MKTEDWLTLSVLYQTKNLTLATKQLFISQPALTIRLRNIERELGCQIAVRNNKGIFFTPEGEYLVKQSVKIMELIDESMRYVKNMSVQNIGTLRMATPSSILKYFLPKIIQEYCALSPGTKFQIETFASSEVVKKISSMEAHCGFVHGEYGEYLPRLKIASPQAFAISARPITLETLENMPIIFHNTTKKTKQMVDSWWENQFHSRMDVRMDVKDLDTCLLMVEHDLGAGIVFGDFFRDRYNVYTIPLFHPDGTPFVRDIWFLYAKELLSSPCISSFLRYLEEKYGQAWTDV